tara:strand:+ start:3823 stop:4116 length:294 start_codon:yes stop_codon:yes gene_type:complete
MITYKKGNRFPDKAADAQKIYSLFFRDQMDLDESITAVTWSSDPTGLLFINPQQQGRVATVMIGGGVGGQDYDVICKIYTNKGQQNIEARKKLNIKG